MDEELLAHLQLRVAEQAEVRGDADQRRGGRVLRRDFVGRGIEPTLVDGRVLGERPLAAQQSLVAAPHAVAHAKAFRLGPDRLDRAGQIAAEDERHGQLERIRARADVRVDRIDGHGLDLDEHLGADGLGLGQVAVDDVVGRARLLDIRGLHRVRTSADDWIAIPPKLPLGGNDLLHSSA